MINDGVVFRTNKKALKKSRMERMQENRDLDEIKRNGGGFRRRGGRDDGRNANEVLLTVQGVHVHKKRIIEPLPQNLYCEDPEIVMFLIPCITDSAW